MDNWDFEKNPYNGPIPQKDLHPNTYDTWPSLDKVYFPEKITTLPPKKTSDGGSTDYYQLPQGSKDLQDIIEAKDMNFSIGNIFKACYRLGEKQGTSREYDLRKIIFFATRELNRKS